MGKADQFVYIEQDINYALHLQVFSSESEAIAHSKRQVLKAVKELLGEGYVIPPEHIDKDGFIEHLCRREKVSSSEWAWYVYDGMCDTARGYIEQISFEGDQPGHGRLKKKDNFSRGVEEITP